MAIRRRKGISPINGEALELVDEAFDKALDTQANELTPGRIIRSHRKCLGLTQEAAAQKLGFTKQMLCQLEKDVRLPSLGKALEIAQKLEMDVPQFLEYVGKAWLSKEGVSAFLEVKPTDSSPQIKSTQKRSRGEALGTLRTPSRTTPISTTKVARTAKSTKVLKEAASSPNKTTS